VGVWMAILWFAMTAILCLVAQLQAAESLFQKRPTRARMRLLTALAIMFLGMGAGALGTAVFMTLHTAKGKAAAQQASGV